MFLLEAKKKKKKKISQLLAYRTYNQIVSIQNILSGKMEGIKVTNAYNYLQVNISLKTTIARKHSECKLVLIAFS